MIQYIIIIAQRMDIILKFLINYSGGIYYTVIDSSKPKSLFYSLINLDLS